MPAATNGSGVLRRPSPYTVIPDSRSLVASRVKSLSLEAMTNQVHRVDDQRRVGGVLPAGVRELLHRLDRVARLAVMLSESMSTASRVASAPVTAASSRIAVHAPEFRRSIEAQTDVRALTVVDEIASITHDGAAPCHVGERLGEAVGRSGGSVRVLAGGLTSARGSESIALRLSPPVVWIARVCILRSPGPSRRGRVLPYGARPRLLTRVASQASRR